MTNWLEEAERQVRRQEKGSMGTERMVIKRDRIRENYQKNQATYDNFTSRLNSLVVRVNNLPLEQRKRFGKIDAKNKESKLDNQLYIYSSSRRMQKRELRSFWNIFRPAHYKHIRVIYISVSKFPDMAEIEVKEQHLLKEKIRSHTPAPQTEKQKYDGLQKVEDVNKAKDGDIRGLFLIDMNKLTPDFGMQIIDWLVFATDIATLNLEQNNRGSEFS